MEIRPGTGYGKFTLGMKQEQVVEVAGDADRINDLEEESDQYIIYYYYDDQVKLYFDKDKNYRLLSIEIFDKKAVYNKVEVIDLSDKDLKTLLYKNKVKYQLEEYPNFHIIYVHAKSLYFNVELDRVRSVEMQPFLKDTKVIWPKVK